MPCQQDAMAARCHVSKMLCDLVNVLR
jgi:hypothetical protein